MATHHSVSFGTDNSLLPEGTKTLPELMWTNHLSYDDGAASPLVSNLLGTILHAELICDQGMDKYLHTFQWDVIPRTNSNID